MGKHGLVIPVLQFFKLPNAKEAGVSFFTFMDLIMKFRGFQKTHLTNVSSGRRHILWFYVL